MLGALTVFVLLVTFILLAHPYHGIWHDGILYTVQALYNAHPNNFRYDLFFQFGSQDAFSLYGKLYEKLIALTGLRDGNRIGLFAAQVLWWTGMWRLSKKFLPAPWHWIAVVFVAAMPADYGDELLISYSEPFLSARLPAEALSLWALCLLMERQRVAAIVLTVIAMAIHPLIGAVGFVMVVMGLMPRAPWWRIFGILLAAFVCLQLFSPPAFALHPLDMAWREVLQREVSYLFPSTWSGRTWSKACWIIALPLIVCVTAQPDAPDAPEASSQPQRQRFWGCLALLGVAGVSFSAVGDVLGHDAIWIQLQFWRVLWLLTAMQWLAIATVIRREWQSRPALIWLLAICWLLLEWGGGGFIALGIAGLLYVDRVQATKGTARLFFAHISGRYKACLIALTVASALWWAMMQIAFNQARMSFSAATLTIDSPSLQLWCYSQFVAIVAGILCTMYVYRTKRSTPLFYGFLFLLLAYAVANFDQRATAMKVSEPRLDIPALAPFAGRVLPGQMVYWDGPLGDILYPWLLMRTASYFSPSQSSGIVFHRQTTFEALHRADVIRRNQRHNKALVPSVASQDTESQLFRGHEQTLPLTRDGIVHVCQVPHLDFVVSQVRHADLPISGEWAPDKPLTYWLYDCKQIDAMATAIAGSTVSNTQ